jgi:hypothetical protein
MPIGWELAAANVGERVAAAEMLQRVALAGHVVIADAARAGRRDLARPSVGFAPAPAVARRSSG